MVDPQGKIVQTNFPSGVFGHFWGWPTTDWLGNKPNLVQGGGFFPVKNKDNTSTVTICSNQPDWNIHIACSFYPIWGRINNRTSFTCCKIYNNFA